MRFSSISLFVGLCGAATIAKSAEIPAAAPAASSPVAAASSIPAPQGSAAPQVSPVAQASLKPAAQGSAIPQGTSVAPLAQAPSPLPQAPSQVVPVPAGAQGGAVPAAQGSSAAPAVGMPSPVPAQGGASPAPKASAAVPSVQGSPVATPLASPKAPQASQNATTPVGGSPKPQVVVIPQPNATPKPAKQPSVVSCAPEQPAAGQSKQIVAQNGTAGASTSGVASNKKLQSFVFWSNVATSGEDQVMALVLGAIEASGGVIKSNLNITGTAFRGVTGTAAPKVLNLVEEYGKLVDYQVERDCVATIGPISIGSAVRVVTSNQQSQGTTQQQQTSYQQKKSHKNS